MKIKVENFQSINKAEIEVKGLTVITGQNNTGKSALARAVMGAFTNLRGNSFVRQGTDKTKVFIDFEDGNHITWAKGKNTNEYEINGKLIQKVGTDVPDEILNLGVKSVIVDNKEIHPQFAKQFQQVFLIDLPPSSLASALSDVEIIQQLEQATSYARTDIRTYTTQNKLRQEQLNQEKINLEKFDKLDDIEKQINKVSYLEQELNIIENRLGTLSSIKKQKEDLSKLINNLKDLDQIIFKEYSNILELNPKIDMASQINIKRKIIEVLLSLKSHIEAISFDFRGDIIGVSDKLKDITKISKIKGILHSVLKEEKTIVGINLSNININEVTNTLNLLNNFSENRKTYMNLIELDFDLNKVKFSDFDISVISKLNSLLSIRKERTKVKLLTSILEVGLKNVTLSNNFKVSNNDLFDIKAQKEDLNKELSLLKNEIQGISLELDLLNTQIGDTCPLCKSVCKDEH